jgi:transposase
VTALAGLAPFDNDSGTHQGQRHIAGGRKRLRRSLYALRCRPPCVGTRLPWSSIPALVGARGKTRKAALIACARKLLIYANTVVARGTAWMQPAPVREHKPA